MNAKLTLSLDRAVIESGKKYAARAGKSLSQLVEGYLSTLASPREDTLPYPVSPSLRSLMGVGAGPCDEEDYKRHVLAKQG